LKPRKLINNDLPTLSLLDLKRRPLKLTYIVEIYTSAKKSPMAKAVGLASAPWAVQRQILLALSEVPTHDKMPSQLLAFLSTLNRTCKRSVKCC
jgi:hypothetical protein